MLILLSFILLLIIMCAVPMFVFKAREVKVLLAILLAALLCIPSYFIWFILLYRQIIPLDKIISDFYKSISDSFGLRQIDGVHSLIFGIVLLVPPMLLAGLVPCILLLAQNYIRHGRYFGK
ncbi:MAG: hypothetical protein MSG64_08895 [Pyrinomonadaceae bacterium MAG19_C2-C3]|nr:hypothetical protein [Pyrinomonadaceae bacterium MAG19_C2-C3]